MGKTNKKAMALAIGKKASAEALTNISGARTKRQVMKQVTGHSTLWGGIKSCNCV